MAGQWVYPYRAIDQFRQVIDVLVSEKRELAATRRFFAHALEQGLLPSEVSTDRAPAYPQVIDELLPAACHVIDQHANKPIESDHGRLTSPVDERVLPPANATAPLGNQWCLLSGEIG